MQPPIPSSPAFNALFLRHAAASLDKQLYLSAVMQGARWSFSLDEGVLAVQRPHELIQLNVQILATESTEAGTWLWGWANAESGIKPFLLKQAQQLRHIGLEDQIPELAAADLKMSSPAQGERLLAVASGLTRAGCTFSMPYPGGVLHMLIKDPRYKRSVLHPLPRIARVFPMLLQRQPVSDQRQAYLHYLQFYRLKIEEQPGPRGHQVTAVMGFRPRAQSALPASAFPDVLNPAPVLLEPHVNHKLIATFDAENQLVALVTDEL